jgi:hypothetical protein
MRLTIKIQKEKLKKRGKRRKNKMTSKLIKNLGAAALISLGVGTMYYSSQKDQMPKGETAQEKKEYVDEKYGLFRDKENVFGYTGGLTALALGLYLTGKRKDKNPNNYSPAQ